MNKGLFTSNSQDWETPQDLFNLLNQEFNFTLDPCCTIDTAKCEKFYTLKDNGLIQDWTGETVFCNPPYSRELKRWIYKCFCESKKLNTTVVMLIPARTDTKHFHEYIYGKHQIRFIKGRLRFQGAKWNAPFPSMIVVMK
ncbi:MAG TPA: adenine methyltransferase [Maribacter sp.]|nr:adenine methyltransferase [Maribacter sp.]